METVIGRTTEKKILNQALLSGEAELIAVYGRRRVGKTFLIRETYQDNIVFEFVGINNAGMSGQLEAFALAMQISAASSLSLIPAPNWIQAFHQLQQLLEPKLKKGKRVIFFDEFPWANSPRSGFLEAFAHFW